LFSNAEFLPIYIGGEKIVGDFQNVFPWELKNRVFSLTPLKELERTHCLQVIRLLELGLQVHDFEAERGVFVVMSKRFSNC